MANRTNTFTATDGSSWPASSPSGSWTHTSDPASGGTGVSRTVQGNRGRIQWSTTAVGTANASHLDRANFTPTSFDLTANAVYTDTTGTIWNASPGVLLRTAGTAAGTDCYRVLFHDFNKNLGLTIAKRTSGTVTVISGSLISSGLSPTANDSDVMYVAVRAVQRTSDLWICAKAWTTGTEPEWPTIGTTGYSSSNQVLAVLDSTSGLWNATGGVALYSYWFAARSSTSSMRWDDVTVRDLASAGTTLTGTGQLTAAGSKAITAAAALAGAGTLTATGRPTFKAAAALAGVGTLTATAGGGTVITDAAYRAQIARRWNATATQTRTARPSRPQLSAAAATSQRTVRPSRRWTATPREELP